MTRKNYGAARPEVVRGLEDFARQTLKDSTNPYDTLLQDLQVQRGWKSLGLLPATKTCDSDARERANFDAAERLMQDVASEAFRADPSAEDDGLFVTSYDHWGFGWIAYIFFDTTVVELVAEAEKIADALAEHQILNDQLFAEYEWEDNHPSETECYSSDPDCPCPVKSHECSDEFANTLAAGEISQNDDEWWCQYCSRFYAIDEDQRAQLRLHLLRIDETDKRAKGQQRLCLREI